MTRPPLDPDELLTAARKAITRGLQLAGSGDVGPANAWLGDAAKAIENLDAYLTMGGRLPSQWKRARPAAEPSAVDKSRAARCGARDIFGDGPCTRLRGHHGTHKHEPTGHAWS